MAVSLNDLFQYIGKRVRPLREGEAVFLADHVVRCGMIDKMNIIAYVVQSSGIKHKPHTVTIKFFPGDVKQWDCKCSCKAGEGGCCKHIVATLLYANKNKLETLSSTDVEQKWGKNPAQEVQRDYDKATKVQNFCHVKRNTCRIISKPQTRSKNMQLLLDCQKNSALARFVDKSKESSHDTTIVELNYESHKFVDRVYENLMASPILLKEKYVINSFYKNNILKTADQCIQICKDTIGQTSDIWHRERKFRITASRFYGIYTYTFNKNPDWERKCKLYTNKKFTGNANTRYGQMQEEPARNIYEKYIGKNVLRVGLVIHPIYNWLACSPDGIIENLEILIEIKCPVAGKNLTAIEMLQNLPFLVFSDGIYNLKKNHSSFDDTFVILEEEYDEKFIVSAVHKVEKAYFHNMLPLFCK